MDGITFQAIFSGARTTLDGGWKITLDVDQSQTKEMLQLIQMRDQLLQIGAIIVPSVVD